MEVRVLGDLEVLADDGSAVPVRGTKARTLLTVLALHRGEPVVPDRLIDILWGEDPPGNPTNALQALVATLRRTIGASAITTGDAGYALAVEPDQLDLVRFEHLVAEGCRYLDHGDAVLASNALHDALELCADEPLIEFAYADFAVGERARLQELVLAALEGRIEADLLLGRHAELVGELEVLCERHPLRERLWELQMLALYRSGRQADALRVFADVRERMIEEFGLEPGPGLRELEGRVLVQDPTLDRPGARGAGLVGSAGNLRARLTSFIGRDDDLARLVDSLTASRLVTLIGPGGAGKTRLAIEAAASVRDDLADGAWLVELAGVHDTGGVAPALAAALRVAGADGIAGSTLDLVVAHLRGRSLVVVLDNCEHVIDEAANVAEILLGEVPELRVLATSREALGVPGELLVPVRGLAPDAAAEVFADRACAVRPDFVVDAATRPLVDDVCRRLDGLPLALELAAARMRALPLAQLVELLDDRFRVLTGGSRTAMPRQQTLRAVVDWSYDLLFEDERRLFARLSVFAGGWSLDAARAVCSDALLPEAEILDLLLHLVDKSLVVADFDEDGEARYSQLQTLAHYARERLAETGDGDAVRERHARWHLALAERARTGLRGEGGPVWRSRLLAEWDNLRVALDWFIQRNEADAALGLTDGVAWLWFLRGDPFEAARWLEDAMAVPGATEHARAAGSTWRAFFGAWLPSAPNPLPELHAAVDVLRSGPRRDQYLDAVLMAADVHTRSMDIEGSLAVLAEARAALDAAPDEWREAIHDYLVARNLAGLGEVDRAAGFAAASVERFKAIGEAWLVFEGLGVLAMIHEGRGALEEAAGAYRELIDLARAASMSDYELMWEARLAAVLARQGDDELAMQLYAEAEAGAVFPVNIVWARVARAGAARRLGDPEGARRLLDEALALAEANQLEVGCGAALTGLSWWALDAGDLDIAADFAAEARRHAAAVPGSRLGGEADIVAAAIAYARSGAVADRDAFTAMVDQRSRRGAGAYNGLHGGSIGEYFDEPDVAAFVRSLPN